MFPRHSLGRLLLRVLLCLITAHAHAQTNADPVFDVWEYTVHGNSVLPADTIERSVYAFLGPRRRIADVEAARQALEAAYRKAGYGTVQVIIPEQAVEGGVVQLKVLQGRVQRVRVAGARYYDQGRILEHVPALAAGTVPNFLAAQTQLNAVNRFPGRRVVPVLRAGETPGSTEVDLRVEERRPYGGAIELNNRHSANTSRTRLNLSARYDNLWQRQHAINLQYQTAPEKPREARVWSLSYDAPFADSEDRAVFYALRSRSDVATLGDITVLGNGQVVGARWIRRLTERAELSHSFTAGVDYKDFDEVVTVPGSAAIATPLRYLPFALSYDASRPVGKGLWRFGTGLSFAMRGVVTKETQFADKRFKARGNYVVWKWDVQRVLPLPRDFSLFARLDGQLADQPLVSNEQYAAGGADSVRGYLESEALGDHALHTSIEVRTPVRKVHWRTSEGALHGYGFFDAAALRLLDPLPGQTRRFNLAATGLGMRFTAGGLSVTLAGAWALKRAQNTDRGDVRAHLEVRYEF